MKLYYAPGTCALAPHIIVREAGLDVALEAVDLKQKRTARGHDYRLINRQGSVPALELDDGEVLTEAQVVLQYLAARAPKAGLAPAHGMAHWRLLETLAFIATELHKGFGPLWHKPAPEVREAAIKHLAGRFALLEHKLDDKPYLLGDYSIADAYAFVTMRWARHFGIDLSGAPKLEAYFQRMLARPAVRQALEEEGLPAA